MLVAAASGISNWGSISSSSTRAKQLAKKGVVSVGGESYSEVLQLPLILLRCDVCHGDYGYCALPWNRRGSVLELYGEYEPGKMIAR